MGGHEGLAVGVDLGGTKLAAGLVAADGSVVARGRRATPAQEGERIVPLIGELVTELVAAHRAEGIPVGVGAPGAVDVDGVLRYAPNLDLRDHPLRAELEALLDVPVVVDNDANVAAWGEYRVGAGAGAEPSLVMLTLGTGVGGGLVMGDALVRGVGGMAGELGHLLIADGGRPCPCGNHGCLEAYASGTALGRRAAELAREGALPADSLLADVPVEELTGKAVTVAGHRGDPAARDILTEAGHWLGVGIAGLVNALDPAIVVVGGGAMEAGELVLEPARQAAQARLLGRAHRQLPPVVRARLTDEAGIIGAGLLALETA